MENKKKLTVTPRDAYNMYPALVAQNYKITFMERTLKDFTDFVIELMGEGHHDNFEDHFEFMKAALEDYIQDKTEEMKWNMKIKKN